jgi:hypothetical protein
MGRCHSSAIERSLIYGFTVTWLHLIVVNPVIDIEHRARLLEWCMP